MAHDPPPDDGSGVRFYGTVPILSVENLDASLEHYQQRLGFSVAWVWGEPPTFASVQRGHVALFLCEGCQGQPQTWVSVFIDDVDELHREYQRRGATIVQPPTNHEWGMREMLVEDRDGHRLRIGHGLDD
ncbi:MAG: VOC family protein [Deltaproteobacteria bacterium]|nr:VOC family protein [Deltaproteobacteria bacterium]